ncbi:kinase [Thraustotheca clavata]|uniref:Kinase n=1 Tax=Thraustotheca clavata TaxID=74557 RepID=A0A1V9YSI4_9STRA|nr:kinase [Thraustotheca clavata]
MEYMDYGNLRSYLDNMRNGIPTEIKVTSLQVAWILANALFDLHHNNIIYRGLSSEKVLLSSAHYVKLNGYTPSREYIYAMTRSTSSQNWTAPEVFKSGHYDFPADIYSFGVILTEVDTLQKPYANLQLSTYQLFDQVSKGKLRPNVSPTCPVWLRELTDQCLAFDPRSRPTAQEIVDILKNEFAKTNSDQYFMKSAASPTILSTNIVCKVCNTRNHVLDAECNTCSQNLPTIQERGGILLKRVDVAKKKGISIKANGIYDGSTRTNNLKLIIQEKKLFRLIVAFGRAWCE